MDKEETRVPKRPRQTTVPGGSALPSGLRPVPAASTERPSFGSPPSGGVPERAPGLLSPPSPPPPPPGSPTRYFTLGFDPRAHACVLQHVNGIAVVCLAPGHPVLARRDELTVVAVDFKVGSNGSDLSEAVTSGKKKRGALAVHPGFVLCSLVCRKKKKGGGARAGAGAGASGAVDEEEEEEEEEWEEERHVCRCGVKGKLVSVNKRLLKAPGLAATDPLGEGHLAIVQLKPGGGAAKLLGSEEEYRAAAAARDGRAAYGDKLPPLLPQKEEAAPCAADAAAVDPPPHANDRAAQCSAEPPLKRAE